MSTTTDKPIEEIRARANAAADRLPYGDPIPRAVTQELVSDIYCLLADDGNSHGYVESCSTCKAQMFKLRKLVTPTVVLALIDEVDRLKAERDELGNGIAQAAIKRGIIDGLVPLTGPQLLMVCDDLSK